MKDAKTYGDIGGGCVDERTVDRISDGDLRQNPHVFVTSHGARGASQQLPYPPAWRGGYYQCYKK